LLAVAASALIISYGGIAAFDNYKSIRADQKQIKHLQIEREQLHKEREELQNKSRNLEEVNSKTQLQLDQQRQTEDQLKKEIEQLKIVKAERERIAAIAASAKVSAQPSQNGSVAAGWHYECRSQRDAVFAAVQELGLSAQWQYIDYIFGKESCHDPGRLNSSGCGGLGQACPLSKLPCGANDIKCQVSWFNGYAQGKGGWATAYNIWLSKHWW